MQIRCPHCQNAIELVDDSDFQSIDCPSCGSQFGLVDVDEKEIGTKDALCERLGILPAACRSRTS